MLPLLALLLLAQRPDYETARAALSARRAELSSSWRKSPPKTRGEARTALLDYLDTAAFPAWEGTPWAYSGTSTTPRTGTIACGYFVTTVLEQAGFRLERVRLAQQASSYIVSTLARGNRVEWFRPADNAAAVAQIRARFGDGLLVVGFDYHVGFLRLDGERAAFCHSSVLEPAAVTCEDPVKSPAFVSRAYVVADALNDAVLDDWVLGRVVPSQLPSPVQRN